MDHHTEILNHELIRFEQIRTEEDTNWQDYQYADHRIEIVSHDKDKSHVDTISIFLESILFS